MNWDSDIDIRYLNSLIRARAELLIARNVLRQTRMWGMHTRWAERRFCDALDRAWRVQELCREQGIVL